MVIPPLARCGTLATAVMTAIQLPGRAMAVRLPVCSTMFTLTVMTVTSSGTVSACGRRCKGTVTVRYTITVTTVAYEGTGGRKHVAAIFANKVTAGNSVGINVNCYTFYLQLVTMVPTKLPTGPVAWKRRPTLLG